MCWILVAGTSAWVCSSHAQSNTGSPDVTRNQRLVQLGDNEWIYMAPVPSKRWVPVFGEPDGIQRLVETREPFARAYSNIVYGHGRLFYFGGGHGSWPGNDVEIYDISRNIWRQSYQPNVAPRHDPIYGSGGSAHSVFNPATGQARPYTIHGYARTTYHARLRRYICTASFVASVSHDPKNDAWVSTWDHPEVRRVFGLLSFDPNSGGWEQLADWPGKAGEGHLSQWDKELGGVLSFGKGGVIRLLKDERWIRRRNAGVNLHAPGGIASVYLPDHAAHLITVQPQGDGTAYVYLYFSLTERIREIAVPETLQTRMNAGGNFVMAYDTNNRMLIGLTANRRSGKIEAWSYDVTRDRWNKLPIPKITPPIGRLGFGAVSRAPFNYDPVHNVFILVHMLSVGRTHGKIETWAYRYRTMDE